MRGQAARVPDLLLERFRLGEMSGEERLQLERRLAGDPAGRERLVDLERSDLEIRRRHPPEWLAAQVRRRLSAHASIQKASHRLPVWIWPAALLPAVVVVMVVVRVEGPWRPPEDRVKGLRPSLVLYRNSLRGSQALQEGAPARAGDVVRLGYRAAGRDYGTILSIDGRGVVTLHLPRAGTSAPRLEAGHTVFLDRAYELDDAPRIERFYLVASEEPFDLAPVLDAARRAAVSAEKAPPTLDLRGPFEQSAFSLAKEETR